MSTPHTKPGDDRLDPDNYRHLFNRARAVLLQRVLMDTANDKRIVENMRAQAEFLAAVGAKQGMEAFKDATSEKLTAGRDMFVAILFALTSIAMHQLSESSLPDLWEMLDLHNIDRAEVEKWLASCREANEEARRKALDSIERAKRNDPTKN